MKLKSIFKRSYKYIFILLFIIFNINSNNICFASSDLELYCNCDLIMDYESGNVLFENNGYKKVYPASTTKILTAILALENLNLDEKIVVSKNAVYSTPVGSSVIYLQPGEIMTVENLLYGLLIKSGNDAANVLAEAVSGNTSDFVLLMNKKLDELKCTNSHFTNAHGFHDKNHYTTVYDMAKIMQYAMKNDNFRKIVETKEYTIPATNKSEKRVYTNTNKMFNKNYPKMYYEYVLGGKTGYTEEARGTFIGYGKKDDKIVIVAAFDGSQNINKQEGRFLDSITLFEYAFNNFNKYKFLDKNLFKHYIYDENTHTKYLVSIENDLYALYKNDSYAINYKLNILDYNLNEKNIGEKVGNVNISSIGSSLNTSQVYDLVLIEKSHYFKLDFAIPYLLYTILLILTIAILKNITIFIKYIKKRKKHKKEHI